MSGIELGFLSQGADHRSRPHGVSWALRRQRHRLPASRCVRVLHEPRDTSVEPPRLKGGPIWGAADSKWAMSARLSIRLGERYCGLLFYDGALKGFALSLDVSYECRNLFRFNCFLPPAPRCIFDGDCVRERGA